MTELDGTSVDVIESDEYSDNTELDAGRDEEGTNDEVGKREELSCELEERDDVIV